MQDEFTKFNIKVLFLAFINKDKKLNFYISSTMVVTKDTTYKDYYNEIKKYLNTFWEEGSSGDPMTYDEVKIDIYPKPEDNKPSSLKVGKRLNTIKNRR